MAGSALPDNALITLGDAAGPPPTLNRFGISSALKIGRAVYVTDCGLGSLHADHRFITAAPNEGLK